MFNSKVLQIASVLSAVATSGVLAVPDVEAVPITGGCAGYPGYDASTDIAGPWIVNIVNSGNSSIEGFGSTSEYVRGSNSVAYGYITFPTDNGVAKTILRCTANTLEGQVPTGVSGYTWQPLNQSPYPYDATLIYDVSGPAVGPFEHYIDGVKQDGVYLGGYSNSTTWGVKYTPSSESPDNDDFFYIRLLGPNSSDPNTGKPLQDGEFTAFIKIDA